MKQFLLTVLLLVAGHFLASAQKPETATGSYTYYPPSDQSLEEARHVALYRAQMQIIADTYGTVMNMSSTTVVKNSKEDSAVNMFSLSESSVRGEWLETIGEPKYSTAITEQGMLSITVTVTGRIREIKEARADFELKVLKNGMEDKFESNDFHDGDDMFISFACPADGYLTIYLYDGEEQVYCLLPYQQQHSPVVKVEGGKKYIFFSAEKADYGVPESLVDEYAMTCSKSMEMNRIYAIWSPDSYYKAVDALEGENLPRMLNLKSFNNWLSKLRVQNSNIAVKTTDIIIKK